MNFLHFGLLNLNYGFFPSLIVGFSPVFLDSRDYLLIFFIVLRQ